MKVKKRNWKSILKNEGGYNIDKHSGRIAKIMIKSFHNNYNKINYDKKHISMNNFSWNNFFSFVDFVRRYGGNLFSFIGALFRKGLIPCLEGLAFGTNEGKGNQL